MTTERQAFQQAILIREVILQVTSMSNQRYIWPPTASFSAGYPHTWGYPSSNKHVKSAIHYCTSLPVAL